MKKLSKKIRLFVLCGYMLISSLFFTACGGNRSSIDSYQDLKSVIYDLQEDNLDNLYNTMVYITGIYHSQYNGVKYASASFSLRLQDIILTDNCIFERPESSNAKYWFYFDIEKLENNDHEIIWDRD